MEELICIESGPDVQGWFVKGNKYSSGGGVYSYGRRYVLDEDGDEWDLEDSVGETLTVSFFNGVSASFTTASNHDARADDSEGGCRE